MKRTGRLGVLAPHAQAPVVTETTVSTDLLQSLEIITELGVDAIREDLGIFAIDDVLLPVKEPCRNLELCGVLDNGDDALEFIGVELASARPKSIYEIEVSRWL